jgi:hypothetical protein
MLSGVYTAFSGPHQLNLPPNTGYVPINVRLGYRPFLSQRGSPPLIRDRFQMLADIQTAPIYKGIGSYVVGPSGLLRWDVVDPRSRLVPYAQIGAGPTFTDGWRNPVQRYIGREQEFLLQVVGGVRWRISPCCSFDVEGGWQHISNADLAPRNLGLNSVGGTMGFTFFTLGLRNR